MLVVFFYVLGTILTIRYLIDAEQVTGSFDFLSSGYVSLVLICDDMVVLFALLIYI
jgi:hypothetical protein